MATLAALIKIWSEIFDFSAKVKALTRRKRTLGKPPKAAAVAAGSAIQSDNAISAAVA